MTEPTRHAIEVCLQCCKIFAQMACDSANRQTGELLSGTCCILGAGPEPLTFTVNMQPQPPTPTSTQPPPQIQVADDGIPMVMKAMNFCPEEETVQLFGCKALYNFVYRCEHAHLTAVEDGGE